jgi:hypothetical protein
MDRTDYPFEFDEWLRATKAKMHEATDFIGDHRYRHFDGFVTHQDLDTNQSRLVSVLKQPDELSKHSFLPLLRKDKKVRRYNRNKADGSLKIGQKLRPIMYASHVDSCIYGFYSYMLKKRYEARIENTQLAESIVAYRHIPRAEAPTKGKSNIDFAKDVKGLTQQHKKSVVICLDVSKFFDSMDHKLIKAKWADLLGYKNLPIGHYTVYKNITKYRYVFLYDALLRLGYGHLEGGKFIYSKKSKRYGILCDMKTFRKKIDSKTSSIVHKNSSGMGIPQGSPISDIIANLYLETFDRKVLQKLDTYEFGHYRRYSDDILIICPVDKAKQIYDFAIESIKDELLKIKPSKSEAVIIDSKAKSVKDITYQLTGHDGHIHSEREAFQYLGFEIDANDMHIRSGTIAGHYRRALRRARLEADGKAKPSGSKLPKGNKKKRTNRSRWQYFINTEKRTASNRIAKQYKKALKRVKSFSDTAKK